MSITSSSVVIKVGDKDKDLSEPFLTGETDCSTTEKRQRVGQETKEELHTIGKKKQAVLQNKNSLLDKPRLGRGCSDGSTMSCEGFCPERVDGLFLTFRNQCLENKYEEWSQTSSRWWMYSVFLFQAICELAFAGMNIFTYFELSDEFGETVPQNQKLHSVLSIVFHAVSAFVFLVLSLILSGSLKRAGITRVTRENWWRVRKCTIFLWMFVYSSLHMFLDFQIPLQMETAAAVGIVGSFHTVQIMMLSGLPVLWSTVCVMFYSLVLYTSVMCSSGECKGLVGIDGDSYGRSNNPDFGEWSFFAVIFSHFTLVISLIFYQFNYEWTSREIFVKSMWMREHWLRDRSKTNVLSAMNIQRAIECRNSVDEEAMLEVLTDDELAVLKMTTPMLSWEWWCLHFVCCRNETKRKTYDNNEEGEEKEEKEDEEEDPVLIVAQSSGSNSRKSVRYSGEQQWGRSFKRPKKLVNSLGQWGIDWRLVDKGSYIDHGAEGQVFKGQYLCADVALKEVLSTTMSENEDLQDFAKEVSLLSSVSNHPHIVDFIGITQSTEGLKKLFAVTSWCAMNLRDYLVDGPQFAGFSDDKTKCSDFSVSVIRIAKEVASAMAHLHVLDVCHKDLKSNNILLTSSGRVQVCDFGLAQRYCKSRKGRRSSTESTTGPGGTIPYMAPELFTASGDNFKLRKYADVYAFGVLLVAMTTQNCPYRWDSNWTATFGGSNDFRNAVIKGLRPNLPSVVPEMYRKCTEASLVSEPADRPSFMVLLDRLYKLHKNTEKMKSAKVVRLKRATDLIQNKS